MKNGGSFKGLQSCVTRIWKGKCELSARHSSWSNRKELVPQIILRASIKKQVLGAFGSKYFGGAANTTHRLRSSIPVQSLPLCIHSLRLYATYSTVSSQTAGIQGVIAIPLAQTGEGIADCELLKWFVQEGDEVEEFQPLCEVQSDKASVEITSRYKGKVSRVHHLPGDIVKVGETLLELFVDGNDSFTIVAGNNIESHMEDGSVRRTESMKSIEAAKNIITTPAVRWLAKDHGVILADVLGTGKDGRILSEDVLRHISERDGAEGVKESIRSVTPTPDSSFESESDADCSLSSASDSESDSDIRSLEDVSVAVKPTVETCSDNDTVIPVRGFQRAMVKAMTAALKVPHFYYTEEINVDALVQLKENLKSVPLAPGVKLTYLPFLLKSLSLSIQKYPIMNSTVNEEASEIQCKASHNIGVGMATSGGLVVPIIKNVQHLSVLEIAEELARLAHLAATNQLAADDITGGTITVSNFGSVGGKYGAPILSVPQVAIVAIGRIERLPRYKADGSLYPANIMGVTWGADHRVIDGATVSSFCNHWKLLIERPERFLLNMR